MMSKIQILKAIHNDIGMSEANLHAVYDVKDTNFESNSQPRLRCPMLWRLLFMMSKIQILKAIHNSCTTKVIWDGAVYDVKDTNFESNSQHLHPVSVPEKRCLWCQRYKFWKQFTTEKYQSVNYSKLFMMSKIQILKAIHNCLQCPALCK